MPELIPSPQEPEAEQRRIMIVACCIEAGAFATVGGVVGEHLGSAIETQAETSTSTESSPYAEANLDLIGAGIGITLGLAAAFAMCCHYIRQNRARADD